MEGLVRCHCVSFLVYYIWNFPTSLCSSVPSFWCSSMAGIQTPWGQSGLEGRCWAGFSIAPLEAVAWCLEQLCRTVNCFISLESAQMCEFSPQGIHLAENSGYCHVIAHQRLKHGPRFRKWKYYCRRI